MTKFTVITRDNKRYLELVKDESTFIMDPSNENDLNVFTSVIIGSPDQVEIIRDIFSLNPAITYRGKTISRIYTGGIIFEIPEQQDNLQVVAWRKIGSTVTSMTANQIYYELKSRLDNIWCEMKVVDEDLKPKPISPRYEIGDISPPARSI